MSDRIHVGSLEESISSGQISTGASAVQAGIAAGNINVGSGGREAMALSEQSIAAQEQHAAALRQMEAQRRARRLAVPTRDLDVRNMLRGLGHPVTLFAENPGDRRERLRTILANKEVAGDELAKMQAMVQEAARIGGREAPEAAAAEEEESQQQERPLEKFYTPATQALIETRKWLAPWSFERSKRRLEAAHADHSDLQRFNKLEQHAADLYATADRLRNNASQVGDSRPVSCCRYSPSGKSLATGSWSSLVKIWDLGTYNATRVLRGHEDRVVALSWRPDATANGAVLATAGADNAVHLWSHDQVYADVDGSQGAAGATSRGGGMEEEDEEEGEQQNGSAAQGGNEGAAPASRPAVTHTPVVENPVGSLKGHVSRLSDVAWHPSGRLLATTSFDSTWRLWDVETQQELLLQEGHVEGTYGVDVHTDGALVAVGDLAGLIRVWDLRSGKSVMALTGHRRRVLSVSFSPQGALLASSSDDNTARVWDLRRKRCAYTIPGHLSLIPSVRFAPTTGEFLVTASYDKTCKIWSARDFSLRKTLAGHENRVMGVDIHPDERHFATCSFDRTWKLWAHEDEFF